jgi:proline iminopeptidase
MRQKRFNAAMVVAALSLAGVRQSQGQGATAELVARETACTETVMDRQLHLEAEIVPEIPHVPRWCALLELDKNHIHIGDCELYCEQEGGGPPIVLLHGGPGATHHYFHPSFSRAAEFATVIYYDQRGCGVSDYEAGEGYTLDQAVDDLDKLRQRLGFERWVVLGHSYGGLVAQCYALKYPDSLAGLVLVGSSLGFGADTGPSRQWDFLTGEERARIREIHRGSDLSLARKVYNAFLNGDWKRQHYCKPTADQFARIALYEWKHDKSFRDAVGGQTSWLNLRGGFDGCPIPTLIVEGKWDLTWGEKKPAALHANHPNARLVVLDDAGHSPFASNPDEFFRVLREFMLSLSDIPPDKLAAWRRHVAGWRDTAMPEPKRVVTSVGWGYRPSVKIAKAYQPAWLEDLQDESLLLRTAFALYDVKRYEEALVVFERVFEQAPENTLYRGVALVWQGHVLDLLGRRDEAVAKYQRAVDLKITGSMQHSQYRMRYNPSEYAAERLKTPFERVENEDERE